MFDIGFTELLLCLVVALVVIGPQQLPGAVRTVALWIGRLKRSLHETRSEIERQIGADDIRRQLHNEEVMQNLEEARRRIEESMRQHGITDDTPPVTGIPPQLNVPENNDTTVPASHTPVTPSKDQSPTSGS